MALNPETVAARVTLVKGASLSNRAGRFTAHKTRTITDLEHIEYLKPKPAFQVIELDKDGKVVEDSAEARRPKAKPQRIVKLKQEGDGWGEIELDDKKAEEGRAEQAKQWAETEAMWAEEEARAQKAKAEEPTSADPANKLGEYPEEKAGTVEEQMAEVMDEVFPAPAPVVDSPAWDPSMKVSQLKAVLESRGESADSLKGMRKSQLISLLEATDEED